MSAIAGPHVAVVDYGAGNLVSIDQALGSVGADVSVARDPEAIRGADLLVVPGVGAAEPAMIRLERRGLVTPIRDWIAAGRPFLGICLGLQLLFEGSDEDGADDARRPARGERRDSSTPRRSPTSAGTRSSGPATTRCSRASARAPISTSSTRTPASRPARTRTR